MGGAAASRTGDDASGTPEAEALRALHQEWGSAWAIGCGEGRWRAAYRGAPGPVLTRASAPGLELALRAGLRERFPVTGRGAFNRDPDRAAEVLKMAYGDTYDIGFADGEWHAARLDGSGHLLTGAVPDELAAAIRADWGAPSEESPR